MAIEWPYGDANIAEADAVEAVMRDVMAKHAGTMMGKPIQRPGANQIRFLFVKGVTRKAGVPVVASVRATTELERFVHDSNVEFVLKVSWPLWSELTDEQRESVMFHEWCHCELLDDEPGTLPHDVHEFSAVIEAYGLWDRAQEEMGLAMQPHLPGIEGAEQDADDVDPGLAAAIGDIKDLVDEEGISVTFARRGREATIKGAQAEEQAAGA